MGDGKRLKEIIDAKGTNVRKVAKAAGINGSTLYAIIQKDSNIRFGVKDKERIKSLKTNVDVLTMTATPIPRTLHMSIVGIRDMSCLYEPPQDRRPVQTYVLEYDSEIIKEAITNESSNDANESPNDANVSRAKHAK